MTDWSRLPVELGERSYDILVGTGLVGAAGKRIAEITGAKRVFLITDSNVGPLYAEAVKKSLADAGVQDVTLTVPAGEATKSFSQFQELLDRLLEAKVERGTPLVALGGGVIGDLVGFAASVVLRGVDFVQVPTSLLAQVDSSVGGKTGINTPFGKNLVGSFHQPRLVLTDTDTLKTLPRRERLAGYAEVVKYGLITDPEFFAWLEGHGAALVDGDPALQKQAILTSCRIKAEMVREDERESGRRALLNLGHTFGHALEAEFGYGGDLLHGEAVSVGLVLAFDLSARMGLCPVEDAARVRRHIAAVGLPAGLEDLKRPGLTGSVLVEHMGRDKKVEDGKVTFILARGIGQAFLSREVNLAEVEAMLNSALAA